MVELTAEEEILVDTLKNRSSEAERMRNYAKQQQTVSASRPTTSQRPVSPQRPSVPPKTPPVRNGASIERQNAAQQRTPQKPVAPQYNRPVREERSSSQSHYKQVEKIEQKSERTVKVC